MAAYQSNLLGDIYRRQSQRRALTGLPSSYQETRGLYDAALDYDLKKARDVNAMELQERGMRAQERALKDAARSATVGGVGQLAMLPMAYSSAKNLGWVGGAKAAPSASTNLLGGGAGATTAQGGVTKTAAGLTAQGSTSTGAGLTSATSMYGETIGAAGEGAAGAGLLGTAGAVALPATFGSMAGGLLGGPVAKALGTHPKTTKDVMSVAGGAAAGFAVGGPIGAAVGGAIGLISSLF